MTFSFVKEPKSKGISIYPKFVLWISSYVLSSTVTVVHTDADEYCLAVQRIAWLTANADVKPHCRFIFGADLHQAALHNSRCMFWSSCWGFRKAQQIVCSNCCQSHNSHPKQNLMRTCHFTKLSSRHFGQFSLTEGYQTPSPFTLPLCEDRFKKLFQCTHMS